MFFSPTIKFIVKIFALIIDALGIWLILLVGLRKPREKRTFLFISMVALMFLWVNCAYLSRVLPPSDGLLFVKIAWSITPLFFITILICS